MLLRIGSSAIEPLAQRAKRHAMSLALRDAATEVGESYLSARDSSHEPLVVVAYDHLQAETDQLFYALVRNDVPHPVRVVFTRCLEPYECDAELITAVRACGVLEIVTAAVNSERIHPLLGCEFGGPFDRFRAIHDLVGHARTGFGFGLQHELAAWLTQARLHGSLARRALATELLAINCARSVMGAAPAQKAVLLEPELVHRDWARVLTDQAALRPSTTKPRA
jgi:hypothetical protein